MDQNIVVQENNDDYEYQEQISYIGIYVALLIAFLISAYVVQLTWNYTMPQLFRISEINFLQSISLLILINILFGSVSSTCIQMVSK
jgi:hypothetical protein